MRISGRKVVKVRWKVLVPLVLLHIGALAAPFFFTWSSLLWSLVFWVVTGLFGITTGYHRLLAHRSFKTNRLIKYFHATCGVLAFQQGPVSWVRIHRAHHAFSDSDKDPHAQQYGKFYGHIGWPFLSLEGVGQSSHRYSNPSDISGDKYLLFLEKYSLVIGIGSLVVLYLLGGISLLLWAGCLRVVISLHIAFSVNSIAHRFGYRSFSTKDRSTNNLFVALLSFGEGWHNNHHRFPNSPRMGFGLLELDLSWLWISFLAKLGLAWNLKLPKARKEQSH